VKGHAVARDPRVTIVVNDETPPYAIAMIEGVAEIITDQAELRRGTAEIARHYIEGEAAEGFVQYATSPCKVLLRIRPTKVVAQDKVGG
jgi:hypothetical protein